MSLSLSSLTSAADRAGALAHHAWWRRIAALAVLVVVATLGLVSVAHGAGTPTLTSDKADYPPGGAVVLSGTGWASGEQVHVTVNDDAGQTWSLSSGVNGAPVDPVANLGGEFTYSFTLPAWFVASYTATATGPSGTVSTTFTDSAVQLYDQCSNDDGDGYASGDIGCRWINGNLQSNNSTYAEDDATVQRLWLTGLSPGSHTVTLTYGTTKGGNHAYDYLTRWNYSESWITAADRCDGITGCLAAAENNSPQIPDDPNTPTDPANGRYFTIRGGSIAAVSSPSLASGSYTGDSETDVTITVVVPSTGSMCETDPKTGAVLACGVAIWFGAHVAAEFDWGTGAGAGSISGSPYHVATTQLDGASAGQRDNQMQSGAVTAAGTVTIIKNAVPDSSQDFDFSLTGPGADKNPTLDDDADPTLSNSVSYRVAPGTWTLTESATTGWNLTGLVCTDPTNNSTVNLSTASATLLVASGETVTCTFTNTYGFADLQVTKSFTPTFNRDITWSVAKSVTPAGTTTLFGGQSQTYTYTVTLTPTATDSGFAATGTITVKNPNPYPVSGVNVVENLPGCTLTRGGNIGTIAASPASASVEYSCSWATNPGTVANSATVTWDTSTAFGSSGTVTAHSAPASFTTPTSTTGSTTVTVTDLMATPSTWTAIYGQSATYVHNYEVIQTAAADMCTEYTNTASIPAGTVASGGSGSAQTTVTLCGRSLPTLEVTKDVSPSQVPETGGSVTYTFTVTNPNDYPLTIQALSDDKLGPLAGDDDCKAGTVLAPAGAAGSICTFSVAGVQLSGNVGTVHTNVFTATASDGAGHNTSASDDATVDFTDVLPDVSVTKTADPVSVPETGANVTYTFVVTNNSAEAASITSLSDDQFGTLVGDDDCQVGTVLASAGSTGASCTFTVTKWISGDVPDSHVNVFTAIVSDNDGNTDTASDDATVDFTDVLPDVSVTKTADPVSVPETGANVTYTFVVTNNSAEAASITSLSDDQFGTLVGDDDCQVGTVLASAGSTGASCTFTVTKWISGDVPDSHVNVFTAIVSDNDGNTDTASDDATVDFTDVLPDVSVTKTADPVSVPETGANVTYTFVVTNNSAEAASITSLSDDQFGTLVGDDDCQVGTVLASAGSTGASCTFTVTKWISGDVPDSHVNVFTAIVSDNDGNTDTASDDATVDFTDVLPDVSVTKTADPVSVPETGANVTYTFVVTNNSAEAASITSLSDDQFGTLVGDDDCQVGTVLASAGSTGASCTFTVTKWISGDVPDSHVNVFTAIVSDNDGNTDTASDDATVDFTDVLPDVSVTKTADPVSVPETGANVTYTFVVTNNSAEAASITSLSDDQFGTLVGDDDCQVGTVLASAGSTGASCTFTVTKWISGDVPDSHVNVFTAIVSDNDGNTDTASDDATVDFTDVLPDVSVTKTADPVSVPETGANVTYTFVVTNNSAEAASITSLSDDQFGTLVGDDDCQVGTVLASAGSTGASCTFTVTKWISGDVPDSHVNVFTAIVSDNDGNTDTASDDATVDFTDVLPDVSVTKTADPVSVPETGANVTYTFVVTNNSAEAASITSLSDDQFGTLVGDDDCQVGTVLASAGSTGASCTFTVTKWISGDVPDSHVNVFTAIVSDNDGNTDTASDDATVDFTDVLPDVSVTKTADPVSVPETGANVTYTFVVTNNSAEAASITSLSDDQFGTLVGDDDCQVGTVLASAGSKGASCTFTVTKWISGDVPDSHVNVFTAIVSDNDGNTDTASDDATVDFTDVLPDVSVTKTADPVSVPETGANVTYTFVVTNNSAEAASITSLSDDQFGTLVGDDDCQVGTVLASAGSTGASCTFTVTKWISGDVPDSHVNVFTAIVSDNDGNTDTASDDATVTFADVKPSLTVTKTANPTSVDFRGANVTFTFTVVNTSTEATTLRTLTDSVFGDLDGKGTCDVPVNLAPYDGVSGGADTYSCTYTVFLKGTKNANGMGYVNHYNVVTATVWDDDGNSASASDSETVTFTWKGRTPGYWKNWTSAWPAPYKPSTTVVSVFTIPSSLSKSCITSKTTLLQALNYAGGNTVCGAAQNLMRAAVAGLLNEAYYGDAFPAYASTTELINAVNAALASGNRQTIINLMIYIDYWNNGDHSPI